MRQLFAAVIAAADMNAEPHLHLFGPGVREAQFAQFSAGPMRVRMSRGAGLGNLPPLPSSQKKKAQRQARKATRKARK